MNKYETVIIMNSEILQEQKDSILDKVKNYIMENGKVISSEDLGIKKLAYEVAGFRDGFFSTVILALPENQVAEFKRQLRLNDNVIRTMFTEACVKA